MTALIVVYILNIKNYLTYLVLLGRLPVDFGVLENIRNHKVDCFVDPGSAIVTKRMSRPDLGCLSRLIEHLADLRARRGGVRQIGAILQEPNQENHSW